MTPLGRIYSFYSNYGYIYRTWYAVYTIYNGYTAYQSPTTSSCHVLPHPPQGSPHGTLPTLSQALQLRLLATIPLYIINTYYISVPHMFKGNICQFSPSPCMYIRFLHKKQHIFPINKATNILLYIILNYMLIYERNEGEQPKIQATLLSSAYASRDASTWHVTWRATAGKALSP